ncbi:4-hydroxyphenylpyruvate dioxygenase (plasmid) [Candidatus Bandiella numerosa]|uniref:4-hydroxyphenylpyruvate dioxygenase n=1 Tax=Candidatus Bandiella numerosa TaxID=2570586 RepID=UPI00249DF00E|nr:4-hydroxyphenylpyruvate dioxygenase [Candidatus Bandiella numerosa]WHA05728.1 4-hydroxyphenylpyruvate dioxygenase [Candidatus Bandiella numerosa]
MFIKIKYIEIYVANIVQSKYFYTNGFGFKEIYTKSDQNNSIEQSLLKLGSILLLLTSSKDSESNTSKEVSIRGDTIKDIGLEVNDVNSIVNKAHTFGANILEQPNECLLFESERVIKAVIDTFGETKHTLIQQIDSNNNTVGTHERSNDIKCIDHLAIAVEDFDYCKNYYKTIFGFYQSYKEKIETNLTGMDSIVMNLPNNQIKLVFIKPLKKKLTSQIDMFLKYNGCPGVQHIAFLSTNIINTLKTLGSNGIELLNIPNSYYSNLSQNIKLNYKKVLNELRDLNILIDEEDNKFLLQVFTKPIHTKPTLFYEIIQRDGASNFGKNNIIALFKAMEEQQKVSKEI